MGKRRVQVVGLKCRIDHEFLIGMMVDRSHECEAVHDHYDDHSYIIGQGHQQSAEIVGFHHGLFSVEGRHFHQAVHEMGHVRIP